MKIKKGLVDTGSRVLYSIFVGAGIDYFMGGLNLKGIIAARTTATAINAVTSGPYGWWQDKWYSLMRTTPERRGYKDIFNEGSIEDYLKKDKFSEIKIYTYKKGKKFVTDMLAFNTFEPIVYALTNCVGQYFETGDIDLNQVYEGVKGFWYISPFIAPTMRMSMQGARKLFGIDTSAELAEKNLEKIISD